MPLAAGAAAVDSYRSRCIRIVAKQDAPTLGIFEPREAFHRAVAAAADAYLVAERVASSAIIAAASGLGLTVGTR